MILHSGHESDETAMSSLAVYRGKKNSELGKCWNPDPHHMIRSKAVETNIHHWPARVLAIAQFN